jgi:hypothetical protein
MKTEIKNLSTIRWPCKGLPGGEFEINIGYHWLDNTGERILVKDGLRTPLPFDVNPNEIIVVNTLIHTPKTAGDYVIEFDLVQEKVCWFKSKGNSSYKRTLTIK